jgi:hypothetical protein
MSDTAPSTPVVRKGGKAAALATSVDGESEKDLGMPANDVGFLIDCLMSVTGGTISVSYLSSFWLFWKRSSISWIECTPLISCIENHLYAVSSSAFSSPKRILPLPSLLDLKF